MRHVNLSRWAIEHPALTGFLIALLFVAGGLAFLALGRAEDPGFTLKEMVVAARWPGASPAQMEAQIADPLEQRLRATESIDSIQTYCIEGACVMQVALKDDSPPARVPEIWQQVRRKLDDLRPELPAGAALVANDEYADVYGYVFVLTGAENARLVQAAEQLRGEVLRLPGAGKVAISGELPRQIFVAFDPRRLATMKIAPGQLVRALAQQTAVTPAGFSDGRLSVPVRIAGAPDGVETIAATRVTTPGGAVRISDVATVSRGYADPPASLVRYGGEPAVAISVAMAAGGDGLAFGAALRDKMTALGASLPAGIKLAQVEDQSANIHEAVHAFLIKFFAALAVVLLVAFLTLGARTGIVVALSVPLTLAIVALFMRLRGIGLERISLGALILSLGLLVDDAIISVEAMVVQLEKGKSRAEAAAYAWTRTAFPMLTGTLLTVIGFLPVGFAQSTTSEYAGGIFWVTGAALVFSWLVAVLFTPCLGVKLLPDPKPRGGHGGMYDTPLYRMLSLTIRWCIARSGIVVATTLVLLGLAILGTGLVRQQFFPLSDRPELIVDVAMRPGSSIAATSDAVRQIEQRLTRDADAAKVEAHVGDGAPRFYLPYGPALPDPARATLVVVAKDLEARERLIPRIAGLSVAADAKVHVRRLSLGPSTGFPIQYRLLGPDPDRLRLLADQVAEVLRGTPGATDVQVNWGHRTPALRLDTDPARLAALGADRYSMAESARTLLSGQPAGEVLDGNKRVSIVVRADAADRGDPGRLAELPVTTANGAVPLGQLGQLDVADEYPIVWRRDGALCVTVEADVQGAVRPSEVVARAADRVAAIQQNLPPGYRLEIGGDDELSGKANGAIFGLLPVTLAMMLLLLMVQLQHFGQTLLVLATAPLGLIGAVAALLVTGAPFGFVALLGLIALAGMIMRNTIILVDQVQVNLREGMHPVLAMVDATVSRARPVVLTALAAVFAFIPLCFNVFWGPMAIVMIGGLIGATVLTLLALPAMYTLAFRQPRTETDSAHG